MYSLRKTVNNEDDNKNNRKKGADRIKIKTDLFMCTLGDELVNYKTNHKYHSQLREVKRITVRSGKINKLFFSNERIK